MNNVDPSPKLCPLCGKPNACGMVADGQPAAPCWCRHLTFSPDLLTRVPEAQRGLHCICEACARAAAHPPP